MTDNPFNALGGGMPGEGGFDMNALLEQAQQMQSQLAQAQDQLAETEVTGTSGGVTVTVNGIGELRSVAIATGQFDGSSADDLADLGDVIVAAFRDAKAQADAIAGEKLGPLTGGLGG